MKKYCIFLCAVHVNSLKLQGIHFRKVARNFPFFLKIQKSQEGRGMDLMLKVALPISRGIRDRTVYVGCVKHAYNTR